MQSTRTRIVDLLNQCGEATVEDLTREMGLAPSTVRRHLDVLQRDGQVELRALRNGAGRPRFTFSLTSAGQDGVPQHRLRVTGSIIEELLALRPRETRNKSGSDLMALVFERLLSRLVNSCRPQISAEDAETRLQQTVAALAAHGFEFQLSMREEGCLIWARECICPRKGCNHMQRLLAQLTGARIERLAADVRPGFVAYLVHARA